MKTLKNYFILGMIIISSQTITSQVSIDTVYVGAKNKSLATLENPRYFYYPNLQAYFDVKNELFIFKEDGSWVTSETMDTNFRGYSVRNGFRVPIKYSGEQPFALIDKHKLNYPANYSTKRKPKIVASVE